MGQHGVSQDPHPSEESRATRVSPGVDPCEGLPTPGAGDASDSQHGRFLRLREGRAMDVPGTVEVVFADEWDALCDMALKLASALRPFAGTDCVCEDGTCQWCRAADALREYEDGDR